MKMQYDIPLKTQTTSSNCVQTSTSQFIGYYGLNISPEDIEKEIPVRLDKDGKPMGTLLADIGSWLIKSYDTKATMYVFDTQIIDRTWSKLSQKELLEIMEKVQKVGISTAKTWYAPFLIDAYVDFLRAGGVVNVAKCTNELLRSLIDKGVVMVIVNFNYIYDYPRVAYDKEINNYTADTINGKVINHAIVLTGYEENTYYYNYPDSERGGKNKVNADVLIGAICTAQINSDNYLLTIEN